jgi:tetratricopeptide (TPR) repeat protein
MNRRYTKRWGIAVAMAGLCLWGPAATGHAFQRVAEGDAIPAFSLASVDGGEVAVAGGGGQVIVLAFVRQGQEKSTQALGTLKDLAARHADQVTVVAVVANPDAGDATAWAHAAGVDFPVLLDAGGDVYGLYGVRVMPSTGVIKTDGTLAGTADGFTRRYDDEIEHLIQVALGNASADAPEAGAEAVPPTSDARKAAERHLEKARLLVKRRMGGKAVASAEEAVTADGEYGAARVFLGELLLDEGDENAAKALPHFEKAFELEPKSVAAQVGLARVKSLQGDTQGAVELLERAAMLNPKPEKVYFELGRVHERAGQYPQAVEAYRKALERLLR